MNTATEPDINEFLERVKLAIPFFANRISAGNTSQLSFWLYSASKRDATKYFVLRTEEVLELISEDGTPNLEALMELRAEAANAKECGELWDELQSFTPEVRSRMYSGT